MALTGLDVMGVCVCVCVFVWCNGRIMISRGEPNNIEEKPGLVPILTRIAEERTWKRETHHSLSLKYLLTK
jgi:hypothetical protein